MDLNSFIPTGHPQPAVVLPQGGMDMNAATPPYGAHSPGNPALLYGSVIPGTQQQLGPAGHGQYQNGYLHPSMANVAAVPYVVVAPARRMGVPTPTSPRSPFNTSFPQGAVVPGTQQQVGLANHHRRQNGSFHPSTTTIAATQYPQNPQTGHPGVQVQPVQQNPWQLNPAEWAHCWTPQGTPNTTRRGSDKSSSSSSVSSAGHRHETFYVQFNYRPLPPSHSLCEPKAAKMYVEKYTPREVKWAYPIVLVHGDFHTGDIWTTKPDGGQGWVSFFVNQGFTVYVVDLPACGRSSQFDRTIVEWNRFASCTAHITSEMVEATLTATSRVQRWPNASRHNQWPGTGLPGDGIFDRYIASTVPLHFRRHQRQAFGKDALTTLVDQIGPVILLGQGSGATLSWLAADALPNSVKAVLAVEPAGPPGGTNRVTDGKAWHYDNQVKFFPQRQAYGLADIPLTFDPPVPEPVYDGHGVTQPPLNLLPTAVDQAGTVYLLQRGGPELQQADINGVVLPWDAPTEIPRKLVSLSKMRQLVVTGDASHHATFDAATVKFMEQAGVNVDHVELGNIGIYGNGHLMFLERNSDDIARAIFDWIVAEVPEVHPPVPAAEGSLETQ